MSKIHVVSLGCPKNTIDTELALGSIAAGDPGFRLVKTPEQADVLIVNTCGFIESAVTESIDAILELAEAKRPDQRLIVMGCLVNRYGKDLERELPEVDVFLGTDAHKVILEWLADRRMAPEGMSSFPSIETVSGRFISTPPWRAYLKISEGCSNRCTYCLIPGIRGPHRPFPAGKILEEARALGARGVKELTLVAQDLTAYRDGSVNLAGLLQLLDDQSGIPWIRLLYLNPARVTRDLIEMMASLPSVCPYFDIPVQHASDRILSAMGRGYGRERLDGVIGQIRSRLPEAAMRTTVMLGFPGEDEDDLTILKDFLIRHQFDHVGCFVYSDEEGAASRALPGKVDVRVARRRMREVQRLQAEISMRKYAALRGAVLDVLVEGTSEESDLLLAGRTRMQASGIDGIVYINSGKAPAGEIARVRITDSHVYDMVGEIVE